MTVIYGEKIILDLLDGTDIEVVSKYKSENRSHLLFHKKILTGLFWLICVK
ncbi:hypothetical protein KQI36_10425 [Clostridium senegalense]|uniref:hypothetical protein n=1 Tax=Clostridium senegalense TaxID=1465809 RepID=UPI001C10D4D5|nr:hypothetical protein [Clostridium senegalense]MBU5227054.1 hypothetical protein [Clostridium senegalense]